MLANRRTLVHLATPIYSIHGKYDIVASVHDTVSNSRPAPKCTKSRHASKQRWHDASFETNALISPIFWGRLFFCLAAVDTIE